jgi:hypothetical protein
VVIEAEAEASRVDAHAKVTVFREVMDPDDPESVASHKQRLQMD